MLEVIAGILSKVANSADPSNSDSYLLAFADVEYPKELIK